MLNKTLTLVAVTGALIFSSGFSLAAEQDRDQTRLQDQTRDQIRDQDRIYGSQLMTQQERNEHRNRIRSAKTQKEREQIRAEHHESMKVRAKERGVSIPDDPPAKGKGMMPGGGMGGRGGR